MKNAFDQWRIFSDLDTTRSIIDLLENESSIKYLVDIGYAFIFSFASCKKNGSLYAPTR